MTLTLDQAIARIPLFANANKLVTTPLSGGITNLNYKIEADGKAYVLRITGTGTEKLGIKRNLEYEANLAAGRLGIAPEVVFYIEPEGYLLTRFIKGHPLPPAVIKEPDNLRRVVKKMRLFHLRGPQLKGEFNGFRNVDLLISAAREKGCRFPADFEWIMEQARETEQALLRDPYTPTPCHNDLLNLNWLEEELPGGVRELRLLDWEYAGMGDIFFDLANFCTNHELNNDQARTLLREYFGEVSPRHFARLMLMWPVSELREAMWGTAQTRLSTLDEDFRGYADLWFGRVRQDLADPRREQWLREAAP